MAWSMRNPRTVLIGVLVVSILAAGQLPHLQVAISPQSLIIEGDPNQVFYEDTRATFGSDRITIVYLEDADLFAREKLERIQEVIDTIERLPFVEKTRSLFNVPEIRVVDEFVRTDPFLHALPNEKGDAARIRNAALKNPFVRNNLLSRDGRALAINVYLKDSDYQADPAFDARVARMIDQAIAPLQNQVARAYQIGLPYVRSAIAEAVSEQQLETVAAAFGVLLLVLLVVFRRGSAALIPLVTAGLSILWLLGVMAVFAIPLSVLTAVVPVLLVIIGSTEDVHLLAEYYQGLEHGLTRRRTIRRMAHRLGLAIGLTFITSYIGFLAVGANPINLVREFGLVASTGLAINFLLTALMVPVLLGVFGERTSRTGGSRVSNAYHALSEFLTHLILSRRKSFLLLVAAMIAISLHWATSLHVNNSILNYLASDSAVQQRIEHLKKRLAGLYTMQVVVDGHIDSAFERVQYLGQLEKIQHFIAAHPFLDHSMSLADYMSMLNSAVNDTGDPELPEEDDVVETLMLFVGPGDLTEYLSEDGSVASILVRHGIAESAQLAAVLEQLEEFIARRTDPDLAITITGESVLTDNAVVYLMRGQIWSLFFIVVAIFTVVSLLFITAKAGLIAVVVNLFPIAALFGVMGYANIPLDSATSMIAAIAVGVGIDHTMHFMVRYNQHFRGGTDQVTAVARTIQDEAGPIGAATIALAAGFGTLALSQFPPIHYFGVLSAMTMLFAFVATFLLAPILLSYVPLNTLWDMLGTNVRRELREQCPLFRDMRMLQIRRVILLGRVSHHRRGGKIMQQGEIGDALFILLRGRVAVETQKPDGTGDTLKIAATGEVFGLAALMCGRPRVATATALGEAEILALDWTQLQRIARFFPRSAYFLFRNLSVLMGERLANQVEQVATESDRVAVADQPLRDASGEGGT
jgi:predicted RND superfamily exporter protein/CRP-like cAMP-binding protein